MSTTFTELGLPDSLGLALAKKGITEPFPVQTATIPDVLAGKDVSGKAPTTQAPPRPDSGSPPRAGRSDLPRACTPGSHRTPLGISGLRRSQLRASEECSA